MAARRTANGKFAKKESAKEAAASTTKFTISDKAQRVQPVEYETDLTGSELDVFKTRMRNQFAGEYGFDPEVLRID